MAYIGKQPTPVPLTASDLDDDIISLAKMAGGTDGNLITYDASGNPVAVATGTDGQVLTSAGAGQPCAMEDASGGGYTQATQVASTSGTAITFTGIPAGTTSIIMSLQDVSTGTDNQILYVTLGDSGGLETSGYDGSGFQTNEGSVSETDRHTAAFGLSGYADFDAGNIANGSVHLSLQNAGTYSWTCISILGNGWTSAGQTFVQGGSKDLSAELTQVSLTTSGGATFDAGTVNIIYQ